MEFECESSPVLVHEAEKVKFQKMLEAVARQANYIQYHSTVPSLQDLSHSQSTAT